MIESYESGFAQIRGALGRPKWGRKRPHGVKVRWSNLMHFLIKKMQTDR
ncbi:hypothetical protein QVM41_32035 [Pseudomonas shirazica]